MWIDIALYTSTFSVFLIVIFIITNYMKSKELQNKLDIYEAMLENFNQDIAILKKVAKTQKNTPASNGTNVNMTVIENAIKTISKDISKEEINKSLVPIATFVKNFSVSFKGFETRIDEKISALSHNQDNIGSGFNDENLNLENNPYKQNNQANKLNKHQVIFDMDKDGLSLEEIESKTGIATSELRFILSLQGKSQS